jgi:hypothetical protein
MIIGYGFDFSNDENDDTRLEVHYQDYKNLNNKKLTQFNFDKSTFLGIPVLNELNDSNESILIGHYFFKKGSTVEANVFSYSLKDHICVALPSFGFQVLSGFKTRSSPFKKRHMKFMRQSRYKSLRLEDNVDNIPRYISVYSVNSGPRGKDTLNCDQVFLKQKNKEIKLKYADCKCEGIFSIYKRKSLGDICAYFVE